nr:uncharacterized protein LOC112547348 [Pelodiscus sinensis]|eukprot:XP_025045079.1 uncharacterized protein LOC112547348 [Pelodiscus sinensis]
MGGGGVCTNFCPGVSLQIHFPALVPNLGQWRSLNWPVPIRVVPRKVTRRYRPQDDAAAASFTMDPKHTEVSVNNRSRKWSYWPHWLLAPSQQHCGETAPGRKVRNGRISQHHGSSPGKEQARLRIPVQRRTDAPVGSSRYDLTLSRPEAFPQELSVRKAELRLFKPSLRTLDLSRLNASWPSREEPYRLPEPRQRRGDPPPWAQCLLAVSGGALQAARAQAAPRGPPRSLELGPAVREWAASAAPQLQLQLVFPADLSAFLATNQSSQGAETLQLEVEAQVPVGERRRKSRALEEECRKNDGKCCLKSLKVSFQESRPTATT